MANVIDAAPKNTTGIHSRVEEPKHGAPILRIRRDAIKSSVTLALFVRAGGRCQFSGCNNLLVEHVLTKEDGNFAQQAHIVAFREDGPRGKDGPRPEDINCVDNLMLLCSGCHKLVDDRPAEYPRNALEGMKTAHEDRIETLTGLSPDYRSHVVTFTAPIRGFHVAIPKGDAFAAMRPRYPVERNATQIDLTHLVGAVETRALIELGEEQIDQHLARAFQNGGPVQAASHISLFAFGPIPLLAYLGSRLGDKVPTALFQRHRDTENWRWKDEDGRSPVAYTSRLVQDKGPGAPVGLLLSLSGKIDLGSLPDDPRDSYTLYEMTLEGRTPSPTFLERRSDLDGFSTAYHNVQSEIAAAYGDQSALHLFPAVPAPIAVLCGRERLPKPRPPLHVYDNDRAKGGFTFQLEID